MNAYPAELIQHHYACMLVSGLLPSQSQITSPELSKISLPSVDVKDSQKVETQKSETNTSTTLNPPSSAALASSSSQASSSRAPTPAQAFPQVTKDLCDIFSSRGRNTAWDPSKSQSAVFHTILVDNVRVAGHFC
jgi:hypothetical protein